MKSRIAVFFFLISFLFSSVVSAEEVKKVILPEDIDSVEYQRLLEKYGKNKELPPGYEKQAIVALSFYPELKDVKIVFKIKSNKSPLLSRPAFLHALFTKPAKRTYFIEISNRPERYLEHTLFDNLSFNAQIGVLGHELSHISYFLDVNGPEMVGLAFKTVSSKFIDRLEYSTDRSTIDHGLGYQLLAWSLEVRMARNISEWKGKKERLVKETGWEHTERYMDPDTIEEHIEGHPLYQTAKAGL